MEWRGGIFLFFLGKRGTCLLDDYWSGENRSGRFDTRVILREPQDERGFGGGKGAGFGGEDLVFGGSLGFSHSNKMLFSRSSYFG